MGFAACDVVTVAAITGGGPTQDITFSLGGATPVGIIIRATRAVTAGTAADGASLCEGYGDGTNQRCNTGMAQDATGFGSHVTQRRFDNGKIVQICLGSSNAIDGEASLTSFSANKATITWSTLPAGAYLLVCTAYYGTGCQVAVGDYSGSTTLNGTTTVSGLPFKPRLIHFSTALNVPSAGGSATTSNRLSFGFAAFTDADAVMQACSGFMDRTAGGTVATVAGQETRDNRILTRALVSTTGTASVEVDHELTSVTSDGFVVTTRVAGAISMAGSYMAVYTGAQRAWVGCPVIATSSTGTKAITGLGWKPQAVHAIGTALGSLNSPTGTTQASHISLGSSVGSAREGSAGYQYEDGVTTSDTRSLTTGKLIALAADDGTVIWSATLSSFDADGFTIDVDDASATDMFAAFMALEISDVVSSETENISDSSAVMLAEALSETETISDTPAVMVGLATSETEAITDSPAFMLALAASETETISDDVAMMIALSLSEDETITDEAVLVSAAATALLLVVSETVEISDAFAMAGTAAFSETVEITDAFNFSGSALIVVSETENITDATSQYLGRLVVTSETATIEDLFSFGRGLIASKGGARGTAVQGGAVAGSAFTASAERGEAASG